MEFPRDASILAVVQNCPGLTTREITHIIHDNMYPAPLDRRGMEMLRAYVGRRLRCLRDDYDEVGSVIVRRDAIWYTTDCDERVKKQCEERVQDALVTYNGESKTLYRWCMDLGLNFCTVKARIKSGWPVERALSEPVRSSRREDCA